MKRSPLFVALALAASMLLTSTSAFAIAAPTTWTALGETGSPITDVQITNYESSYDIKMNLTSAAVAGNTYSVLLSPTEFAFEDYTQDASAATIAGSRGTVLGLFALTNWEVINGEWVPSEGELISKNLSTDKKTLTWVIAKSEILLSNFWFAGLATNSVTGANLGQTAVSATPIPGAAWLLGSGILGLVALRRRKAGMA